MLDAANEWARRAKCWLVAPQPIAAFVNSGGRPAMAELSQAVRGTERPTLVAPRVGREFEFGTMGYRARIYARALERAIPAGVPVIVSDDPATWYAASLLAGRHPMIGVLHGQDHAYADLATRFHHAASAMVAVSQRVLELAHARVGQWRVPVRVIPCGIPIPKQLVALPEPPSAILRVIWIGRVNEREKRVSDLPLIASALRAVSVRFQLDIVGDGEDLGQLRAEMTRGQLDGVVRFHGWVARHEVMKLLRRADIMLLPSNFEGMSVAAMEGLASGCAVVGSDTCGLEDYAYGPHSEGVLWIFPRGNIQAAAAAVVAAASVPKSVRSASARRLAEDEFSIERCVDRYADLLDGIDPGLLRGATALRPVVFADVASQALAVTRFARVRAARLFGACRAPRGRFEGRVGV